MEKELTLREALRKLDEEQAERAKAIRAKWVGKHMPGRDGAYTPELKILNQKFGKRFFKLKEMYARRETLPEAEVIKIVTGDF